MPEAQQQRYRVIDRLAAGGMAEVFRAESAGLEGFKKKVAIKRVLPHLSEKKKFIKMFLDEARLGAYLSHSNCVQVFDVGVGDNTYFIVMEYVDGADLKAVIEWARRQSMPFSAAYAVYITTKICDGLDYAHNLTDDQGRRLDIVHRDLSPPNVLITRFGEVKIVDFGLAKASNQLEKSEPGIIKGKFSYLSPEAATGREVDLRTDVFAAGIILWEMLAGRKLFQGDSDFETVKQVQKADVPSISKLNPNVDPTLEQIVNKCLARDPDKRFLTARAFGEALTQWLFSSNNLVTPFDIADVVQRAIRERQKDKGGKAADTIDIGSLIQQTLFEFTSLQEEKSGKSPVGNRPLAAGKGDAVSTTDWGSELDGDDWGSALNGPGAAPAPRASASSMTNEVLAPSPSPAVARTETAAPPAAARSSESKPVKAGEAPTPNLAPPAEPKKSSGAMIGVIVALVAILGAGGAWAAGLFK